MINVKLTPEAIQTLLKKQLIESEDKEEIAKCICQIFTENNKMHLLAEALLSLKKTGDFKNGDKVLIHKDSLSSWIFNISKMDEESFFKNDHIMGIITETNYWSDAPYKVLIKGIAKYGSTIENMYENMGGSYLKTFEKFPCDE
jgi:hypothetical protein